MTIFTILRAPLLAAALLGAGLPSAAVAQTTEPVKVTAWAMHHCGKVLYRYDVANSGSSEIRRLLIGLYHPDTGTGGADLSVLPELAGSNFWLAPHVAGSPTGWNVKLHYPDKSEKFALEWIQSRYHKELWPGAPLVKFGPDSRTEPGGSIVPAVLGPGTTLNQFSVYVDQADPGYLSGRANMDYGDQSLNVTIVKGDTIAPTLEFSTSQRIQRAQRGVVWTVIDIKPKLKDNYDPSPALSLAPIAQVQGFPSADVREERRGSGWRVTLKNVTGRTYQLRFTATDASGNQTEKSLSAVMKNHGGASVTPGSGLASGY